jgi:plasmid replication initiation protein
VLTIDQAYFDLTGGLDRWLYRLVRKHGGKQRHGWRFDFRHLHLKSGSLSPFKRFSFELRDIVRRQPLPGYILFLEVEARGRTLLAFKPSTPGGKPVDGVVPLGTPTHVPSGTSGSCQREPDQGSSLDKESRIRARNLDSNQESNIEERARDVRSLIDTVRNSLTVNARQRRSPAGAP